MIQLDGCLPFLGCTIMLTGPKMQELKLVKHALKKILRMSRQLVLESEYYQFLDLKKMAGPSLNKLSVEGDINSLAKKREA